MLLRSFQTFCDTFFFIWYYCLFIYFLLSIIDSYQMLYSIKFYIYGFSRVVLKLILLAATLKKIFMKSRLKSN